MYKNTLAPYTMVHSIYFLSIMTLHRAYLPFLPLRCSEPRGPFPDDLQKMDYFTMAPSPPDGFWQDGARELFKAARQMIDIAATCSGRDVLVENCLVSFALYNAALVGVYALHFPHMDQHGYLHAVKSSSPSSIVEDAEGSSDQATIRALDILQKLRPRSEMAGVWFRTLNRTHSFFSKIQRDQQLLFTPSRRLDSSSDSSSSSCGGVGGDGLVDKVFREFGTAQDQFLAPPHGEREVVDDDIPLQTDNNNGNHAEATNTSETGSMRARSESTGDQNTSNNTTGIFQSPNPHHRPSMQSNNNRRESWIHPQQQQYDHRPSLPPPPPRQSPSPYTLPSLHQQHLDFTAGGGGGGGQQQPQQYFPPGFPARLQSISSPSGWLGSAGGGGGALLPPINVPPSPSPPSASLINNNSILQLTGSYGGSGGGIVSPPATTDSGDNNNVNVTAGIMNNNNVSNNNVVSSNSGINSTSLLISNLSSNCLAADDLMAFLDGRSVGGDPSSGEQQQQHLNNKLMLPPSSSPEVGIPAGWLGAVWSAFS